VSIYIVWVGVFYLRLKHVRIFATSTVTFDTLHFTHKLRDAGLDEKQAEAVIRVVAEAQEKLVTSEHFDAKISIIDSKFEKITWMLGAVLGLAIANFA
jgi:hypothetical protein